MKKESKNRFALLFKILISTLIVGIIVYFIGSGQIDISKLKDLSIASIVSVSVLFILSQYLLAIQTKSYMNLMDTDISTQESLGLVWTRALGNYLPLSAGVLSNIIYLKKKKELSVTNFLGYFLFDTVLKTAVYALAILCLIFWFYFNIFLFLLSTLVLCCLSFFIYKVLTLLKTKIYQFSPIRKYASAFFQVLTPLSSRPSILFQLGVFHIILLFLLSFQFYIIATNLGLPIGFIALLALSAGTNIIRVSSFLPGNIGVREVLAGGMGKFFSFSFEVGFLLSIVQRVISFIWIILLGGFYAFFLTHTVDEKNSV
jgi:uncharacterized membrane protein YbhN (UPF0104 family)